MQFAMPMMMNRSKSKPEVEFQYGGCPLFETESNDNSAANLYLIEMWYADRF